MGQSNADPGKQTKPLNEGPQAVRAPRGRQLNCQGWPQEAALRMLMNSLDPDVAEQPHDLIACGTTGKVLSNWESYRVTVEALKTLKADETILVQSGKPAGVIKTNQSAPRVLIENSNPAARLPYSGAVESRIRALPFQASAASWTCVGAQEALPIAFQTFDAVGQKYFGGNLAGRLIVAGGMGAAGGALPLAAGLHGAAFLGIDVDGERIRRRIRAGYCDYCVNSLDEALRILKNAVRQKQAVSVGLVGNCAELIPELASRGVLPDVLTDQTSAHDLLNGYIPSGLTVEEANPLRRNDPDDYLGRVRASLNRHFNGMLALQKLGSIVFEFGNGLQAAARECGNTQDGSALPDFVEAYVRPLLDKGLAPVRCVALSGEAGDIRRLDELALELFPDDALVSRWIPLARKYVRFQGLPARVCWLGQQARVLLADRVNSLVAGGTIKAPVVVAWDYAYGGTESPKDAKLKVEKANESPGTTAATSMILNAASGASWVSLESGAEYNQATVVAVADGTLGAAKSLPQVLENEFAAGILRLASAGSGKV